MTYRPDLYNLKIRIKLRTELTLLNMLLLKNLDIINAHKSKML